MSAKQLNEWFAYMNIEPFGTIWEDIRHGQTHALMVNLKRDAEKRPEPFTCDDFRNFKEREEIKVEEDDPNILSAQIRSKIFGM